MKKTIQGLKIGDRVYIDYNYQMWNGNFTERIYGIINRIYKTTFGSKVKDWGVSVTLEKQHPVVSNRKRTTFRIKNVRKVK